MLLKNLIAERLQRFEILAGATYPNSEQLFNIWAEKLGDTDEDRFKEACDWVENNVIKWHILPTPAAVTMGLHETIKKYRAA